MLNCIVIDDEEKNCNLLAELLKKHCPEVSVVAMALDGYEGISLIRKHKPDFIVLDIQMPRMTGFQMLEVLGEVDFDVVFVTAYDQYAIKAIRFSAFDYLLKPLDKEALVASIERLQQKKSKENLKIKSEQLFNNLQQPVKKISRITLHSSDGVHIIPITDIIYMAADGQYTHFYLRDKSTKISSHNLKEYEELLAEHNFFRTHHSYLINMDEVKKYLRGDGGTVIMSNGKELDVSKRRKEEFLGLLENL
jgi:two-component system LytT family response regulator